MHAIGMSAGEYTCMGVDFSLVGAGISGEFENTSVMKYGKAMSTPDKEH